MDYRDGVIKMYTILAGCEDMQVDDVEHWLCENTDYSEDECYFMFSNNPIKIIQE